MNKDVLIHKIIADVSHRNGIGYPDFSSDSDIAILGDVLDEMGLTEMKGRLIANLSESRILDKKNKRGATFIYIGGSVKLEQMGLKPNDILTLVADKGGDPDFGYGKNKRTFRTQDGRLYKIAGKNDWGASYFRKYTGAEVKLPSGEDWERMILVAFNNDYSGEMWKTVEPFWKSFGGDAITIADEFRKFVSSTSMEPLGRGKYSISSDWQGKDGTPKTDLIGGDSHISVKKAGGSQLIGAGKEEAISTFLSAAKLTGKNKPKTFEKFLDEFDAKLGKLTGKLTVSALKKKAQSGKRLTKQQQKDLEMMDTLYSNIDYLNIEMNKLFSDLYFKSAFCFEAATGYNKFTDKRAIANELVEFDPRAGKITKHYTLRHVEGATELAKKTQLYVSFKSGGGVSPYLALRSKELIPESIHGIIRSELKKNQIGKELLTEGLNKRLDEAQIFKTLLDKVRNGTIQFIETLTKIINNILRRIKQAIRNIKKLGEDMFFGIMQFYNIDISSVKITSNSSPKVA